MVEFHFNGLNMDGDKNIRSTNETTLARFKGNMIVLHNSSKKK